MEKTILPPLSISEDAETPLTAEGEDKIIITDNSTNDEKTKIVVMEEDESLLEVTDSSSTPPSVRLSSSFSLNFTQKKPRILFSDFRCICGETFFDNSSELIQCTNCSVFQHARCHKQDVKISTFLCAQCTLTSASFPFTIASTTLPSTAAAEIQKLPNNQKVDSNSQILKNFEQIGTSNGNSVEINSGLPTTLSSSLLNGSLILSARHSLPTLLPAIKPNSSSRSLAPLFPTTPSLNMMMSIMPTSITHARLSLSDKNTNKHAQENEGSNIKSKTRHPLSTSNKSSSLLPLKRGRKPKISSTTTSNPVSSLVPALISKEKLPLSFIESDNKTQLSPPIATISTSNSYIPADHLRISKDARNIINFTWKKFYESALSKRIKIYSYLHKIPVVIAHSNLSQRYNDEIDEDKGIFNLLSNEFSLNCHYWPFCEETPRPLRLSTREFKSSSSGPKSLGVFIVDELEECNSTSVIMPGTFVVMLTGTLVTHSSLYDEFGSDYECANTSQYFLFFHPTLPLAVDARKTGNISRFIRRSCHPNVSLRGIFVGGTTSIPTTKPIISNQNDDQDVEIEEMDLSKLTYNHPYSGIQIGNYESYQTDMMTPATFNVGIFTTERIRPGIDELLLPLDKNEFYSSPCPGPHSCPGRSCLGPDGTVSIGDISTIRGPVSSPTANLTHETNLTICTSFPSKDSGGLSPRSTSTGHSRSSSSKSKGGRKKIIPSPSTPVSPTNSTSLSREERKLQMYVESIQRLEQREKRKSQR